MGSPSVVFAVRFDAKAGEPRRDPLWAPGVSRRSELAQIQLRATRCLAGSSDPAP